MMLIQTQLDRVCSNHLVNVPSEIRSRKLLLTALGWIKFSLGF